MLTSNHLHLYIQLCRLHEDLFSKNQLYFSTAPNIGEMFNYFTF